MFDRKDRQLNRARLSTEQGVDTAGGGDSRATTVIGVSLIGALVVLFLLSTVFRTTGDGGGEGATTLQTLQDDGSPPDTLIVPLQDPVSDLKPVLWLQARAGSGGDAGWGPDVGAPFQLLWQLGSRGGREFFSSPALVEGVLYMGCNDGYIRAVDASSGSVRWSFATSCGICGEPAVDSTMVFIGGQDGYVYALDRSSGAEVWSSGLGYHVFCDVAIMCDTLVLAGNSMGRICALERSTGRPAWDQEIGGIVLGPAVVDTLAVFTSESGTAAVVDAHGRMLWSRSNSTQASAPSADSVSVFVGYSGGMVRRFDLHTGDLLWETDVVSVSGRCVLARPVVAGERVLVGTNAGTLVCLGRERGEVLWEQTFDNWLQLPPAVAKGTVYLACDDQRIHLVDLESGAKLDSLEMDGYSGTAPLLCDGVLYFGNTSGDFRALRGTLPDPEAPADTAVSVDPADLIYPVDPDEPGDPAVPEVEISDPPPDEEDTVTGRDSVPGIEDGHQQTVLPLEEGTGEEPEGNS